MELVKFVGVTRTETHFFKQPMVLWLLPEDISEGLGGGVAHSYVVVQVDAVVEGSIHQTGNLLASQAIEPSSKGVYWFMEGEAHAVCALTHNVGIAIPSTGHHFISAISSHVQPTDSKELVVNL